MVNGIGITSSYPASAKMGDSKKVSVTQSCSVILAESSAHLGCIIRVLSMDGSYVSFSNENLTLDSGTNPGAICLQSTGALTTINITGNIFGITDVGSASLAIQPLNVTGWGWDNFS